MKLEIYTYLNLLSYLQSRLDQLTEKKKADMLTPDEEAELTGILELDRIFTLRSGQNHCRIMTVNNATRKLVRERNLHHVLLIFTTAVNNATRKLVRERAKYLCEYCHSSEVGSAALFAIDHIIPQSFSNSSDEPDNLALACQRCNGYRYNFTTGIDPETGKNISLFNPREQKWSDHFVWSVDGFKIIGLTPIGRATCNRLDLNDDRHNEGSIIKARKLWIKGGWHPPQEDPRLTSE